MASRVVRAGPYLSKLPRADAPRLSSSSSRHQPEAAPKPALHSQQLIFTHGGNLWRDNYLLERWARSVQPVVYLGQTYGGYELLRPRGGWCWLTKDPATGANLSDGIFGTWFLGFAKLHRIGVVHGDIQPGNVALAPSWDHEIEDYLAREHPIVDVICRKDGRPTNPTLPTHVTKPVDIGFGEGNAKFLDLGFTFQPTEGEGYERAHFPTRSLLPPELLYEDITTNL